MGFAALTDTGARLRGTKHAAGRAEIKDGFVLVRRVIGVVAQVLVHRRGIDDFARIQHAARIERGFHATHHRVAGVAHHQLDELSAQPTIPVFAGEGTAVGFDQVGNVRGDPAKLFPSACGAEIEQRARV